MFTFVTGGLRSGKSGYALRRASEQGQPPWLYVAPHVEGDEELKARLDGYRRDQDAIWKLIEAPEHLDTVLDPPIVTGHGAVVIDRFTIWLSNRIARTDRAADGALLREIEALANRLRRSPTPVVLVTTETGLGFLPVTAPDQRLMNMVGLANQILAERADAAVLLVSGIALRLR